MTTTATGRWVERFARAGFLAKAGVYLVLGGLAAQAAVGAGGRLTDSSGAVRTLADEPHGAIVVGVLAVGLCGYALWRFLEAFADANRRGRSANAIGTRAAYALSGMVYGALAVEALRLAVSSRPRGASGLARDLVASDLGPALVFLAGIGLAGYAVAQLIEAFKARLDERLNVAGAVRDHGRWILDLCRIGIAARAVVFAGIGALLLRSLGSTSTRLAAADTSTSDALRLIAGLPQGRWALAAVAAGLMAYGIYQLVHARYRRISAP